MDKYSHEVEFIVTDSKDPGLHRADVQRAMDRQQMLGWALVDASTTFQSKQFVTWLFWRKDGR